MPALIEPYNPHWKTEFECLRNIYQHTLVDHACTIEHIGSTAIPGLPAKPIIDIDIVLQDKAAIGPVTTSLQTAGYIARGEQGVPSRFAFRQSSAAVPLTTPRTQWLAHHLYVCYADSTALKNHLLFRDALLANEELAHQYAALKSSLIHDKGMSREAYGRAKTDFIIRVLARAGMGEHELQQIREANQ